jgi:hypothetical protein
MNLLAARAVVDWEFVETVRLQRTSVLLGVDGVRTGVGSWPKHNISIIPSSPLPRPHPAVFSRDTHSLTCMAAI